MAQDSSSEPEPDDSETEFVEVDPSGRYGRVSIFPIIFPKSLSLSPCDWFDVLVIAVNVFLNLSLFWYNSQYKEVLGKGAFKKVYPFMSFLV